MAWRSPPRLSRWRLVLPLEAGQDRGNPAQSGEGGFGVQPAGVAAAGDEQLGGGLGADAADGGQGRAGSGDQRPQLAVQGSDLAAEGQAAAGQAPQRGPGGVRGAGRVTCGAQPRARGDQRGRAGAGQLQSISARTPAVSSSTGSPPSLRCPAGRPGASPALRPSTGAPPHARGHAPWPAARSTTR